jgi:hypothetical protein
LYEIYDVTKKPGNVLREQKLNVWEIYIGIAENEGRMTKEEEVGGNLLFDLTLPP